MLVSRDCRRAVDDTGITVGHTVTVECALKRADDASVRDAVYEKAVSGL